MKKTLLLCLCLAGAAFSQNFEVKTPAATGTSSTLRSLAANAPSATEGETEAEVPNKLYIPRPTGPRSRAKTTVSAATATSTTFNQTTNGTLPVTTVGNYLGLGRGFAPTQGGASTWTDQFLVPPDTTLAVGPTHILQWVNVKLTILDKATGASVLPGPGYINGNVIWNGLPSGSVCRDTNQGDPVVQYDRLAGRWVLSQFAFGLNSSLNPVAPYALCFAVSTSGDPTGSYHLYEYTYTDLPDYPKLGLWPDAYYMTINNFSINPTSGASSFTGAQVCAYDRAAMLAGTAATSVCTSKLANRFAFLPSDLEGNTPPPVGSPNYVISTDWFFFNAPPYSLRLQKFKPDFVTPANTTFTDGLGGAFNSFVQIPFDLGTLASCGDSGGACVPQPGTARLLDTLSMRPMYRLAYRNLGNGRESLYLTDSVDPTGGAVAGVRWIEIRNPAANPPVVFHNSIFNPDTTNRWMGAVASDKLGNMALGYSVSSAAVSPGVRVAGRLRNDIRNTLRGEITVAAGAGNQTSTAQRWGDYSTMQIDPADDCTFWYTQVYTTASTTRDWATRIVGFKFNSCQ